MNYQNFSEYNLEPPYYGKESRAFYDEGKGIPQMNVNNMTLQDFYRTPFLFIQEHHKNYKNMVTYALKGIQSESELSKLFFSDKNIQRLQRMIKREVFERTNGQFRLDVDQEMRDIYIAMRAVYLEHARFLPNQIVRQVKRLNKKVVDEVTPGIITMIKQEFGYLKEINKPIDPIPLPVNINSAGRHQLPSV